MAVLLQRRADAEPGADARGQPGLRPWRALRQHRAWLQLGDGHADRAEARRLRGHRGRLRRRSRGGEVLRHQVPQGRARAGRGGDRRDRPRAEDAWRRRPGELGREDVAAVARASPTSPGTSATWQVRRAGGRRDQPLRHRHARPSSQPSRATARGAGREAVLCRHWAEGRRGIEALARAGASGRRRTARLPRPLPDEMPLCEKMRTIAREIYARRRISRRQALRDQLRELEERGLSAIAGLHGQDPVSFSTDPDAQGAPERPRRADPRGAAAGRRRLRGGRSAATS
ncbi:MAG: hypothetical protein KatS3mg118_1939 [Paracoccaceae bacterium]|nr:MAG: hypothetical protein KatS3mg118_1939 [Paracoccaceae bacterium]